MMIVLQMKLIADGDEWRACHRCALKSYTLCPIGNERATEIKIGV